MSASVLLPVTVIGYIVAIVAGVIHTTYRSKATRRATSVVIVATWVLQAATVLRLGVEQGRFPLANVAEYLLLLSWAMLSLHMWLWFRGRVEAAAVVLPPLAGVMAFSSMQLMRGATHDSPVTADGWFLFHATVATLGIAILSVAFAMAVVYLIQDRALKSRKTLKWLARLPSLQEADRIGFRSLTIGFVLLTVGIVTGVLVNAELYQRILVMGPKQVFPILAWFVFAAILVLRPTLGFRGRKSAYLTITGFALGLMTVIGMTL